MRVDLLVIRAATLLACAALALPVCAAGEERELDPDAPVVHHEIVVVAQKREEILRDVPISLNVFTAQALEEAGIETPEHFMALTPNLSLGNSFTVGNSLVTIRGITQLNNGESPLAIVVDGVYQGNQKQLNQELFDVERIEVLKGPQGALYGRNAIGGALNIITRQPADEFEGWVRAFADDGAYGSSFAVSGPLVRDKLLVRLAASRKEADGYIDNVFRRTEADFYEDTSGRLQLRWNATEALTFDLRAALTRTEGGAILYSLFPTDGFANDFSFDPDENVLGFSERDMDEVTLKTVWSHDAVTLTSITGWTELTEVYRGDADFSNRSRVVLPFFGGQIGQGQDLDVEMLSQEIRLTSPGDRRVRWIAGAYALETDRQLTTTLFEDTDGTIPGLLPRFNRPEDNDNTAWAVFGQVDLEPAERWTVSLSARYDRDERDQVNLDTGERRGTSFDAVQPRITVSRSASKTLMTYLNLGTGFRSGGFNGPMIDPPIFKDETSTNLEIGFKSELLSSNLLLDGAAYFTQVDDAQSFRVDVISTSQIIDNMNDVEILGAELTLMGRPAQGLEAWGSVSFNDTEIRDLDGTGRDVGNQTPNNLRGKLNLGAQYARPFKAKVVGLVRIDLEHRDKQYWFSNNLDVQDPLTLLNARLTLKSETWTVALWGRNLTDVRYYVEYADVESTGITYGDLAHLAPPRTYGFEIKRSF